MSLAEKKEQAKQRQVQRTEEEKTSYVNTVSFTGNLVKDLEFNYLSSGKSMIKGRLAVWQPGGTKEQPKPTMFFDLVFWEPNAEKDGIALMELYEQVAESEEFTKGSRIRVEGRMGMRIYQEKPYYDITVRHIELDS